MKIGSHAVHGNDLASIKTYEWSIYLRRPNVSDHPKSDAAHSSDLGVATDGSGDHIDAPGLVPEAGDGPPPRKMVNQLVIMSPPRDQGGKGHQAETDTNSRSKDWDDIRIDPAVAAAHESKSAGRKTSAIIAVAVVAGIAGALGTAMATVGVTYFTKPDPTIAANHARALDESMNRIEADLAALRSNVDRVAKANASQSGKTTDRLDRIEKAQAEPAAKLAKLNDTVEKLRVAAATPPPALLPVAPQPPAPVSMPVASFPAKDNNKEITGSIAAKDPTPAPKADVARLPTVEGWVLHEAGKGGATVEGRQGIFDVMTGDPLPGLGRVDAIRRQDGRWVVVTTKGLIVAR